MGFYDNKRVTFETCENGQGYNSGDWYTEWTTGRRYKHPFEGVKVWEGGAVELQRTGYSSPSWRDVVSDFGNFEVMTKKELPQLYWGDKKVFKTNLQGDCFLVDRASRRVFLLARVKGIPYTLRWAHPNTIPVPACNMAGYVPNRKAMKQFIAEHTVLFTKADATYSLDDARTHVGAPVALASDLFRRRIPESHSALLAVGILRNRHNGEWNDFVTRFTADHFNTQYLTTEPTGL